MPSFITRQSRRDLQRPVAAPAATVLAEIVGLVLLPAVLAAGSIGCGSNVYRIPDAELQRLARLPPDRRGQRVRVQSWDPASQPPAAATAPVTAAAPVTAPPPMATPPTPIPTGELPPGQLATEPPPFEPQAAVVVDWPEPGPVIEIAGRRDAPAWESRGGGPAPTRVPPSVRGIAAPRATRGALPTSVPSVPIRGAPVTRGLAASPGRSSLPSPPVRGVAGRATLATRSGSGSLPSLPSRSGARSGGHGSSSNAEAIVGAIFVVVLIAALVAAAASASEEASQPFDGWVAIEPEHPVHLRYKSRVERVVPLANLKLADTVGVDVAFVHDSEGTITRLDTADSTVPPATVAAPAALPAPAAPRPTAASPPRLPPAGQVRPPVPPSGPAAATPGSSGATSRNLCQPP
jgi:hypothetical protein